MTSDQMEWLPINLTYSVPLLRCLTSNSLYQREDTDGTDGVKIHKSHAEWARTVDRRWTMKSQMLKTNYNFWMRWQPF